MITLAAIGFFLKRVAFFVFDNWKIVLPAFAVLALGIFLWRSCGPKPAKLNEAEIQAAQKAIEDRNDAKLREILTNVDVREKQIDANLVASNKQAAEALDAAREKYRTMTSDQLAAEIEARK